MCAGRVLRALTKIEQMCPLALGIWCDYHASEKHLIDFQKIGSRHFIRLSLSIRFSWKSNESNWVLINFRVCIYLKESLEAPSRLGDEFSWHASISFFRTTRHSRNSVKNGWWDSKHSDVMQWFRNRCKMTQIMFIDMLYD